MCRLLKIIKEREKTAWAKAHRPKMHSAFRECKLPQSRGHILFCSLLCLSSITVSWKREEQVIQHMGVQELTLKTSIAKLLLNSDSGACFEYQSIRGYVFSMKKELTGEKEVPAWGYCFSPFCKDQLEGKRELHVERGLKGAWLLVTRGQGGSDSRTKEATCANHMLISIMWEKPCLWGKPMVSESLKFTGIC